MIKNSFKANPAYHRQRTPSEGLFRRVFSLASVLPEEVRLGPCGHQGLPRFSFQGISRRDTPAPEVKKPQNLGPLHPQGPRWGGHGFRELPDSRRPADDPLTSPAPERLARQGRRHGVLQAAHSHQPYELRPRGGQERPRPI